MKNLSVRKKVIVPAVIAVAALAALLAIFQTSGKAGPAPGGSASAYTNEVRSTGFVIEDSVTVDVAVPDEKDETENAEAP
jgi:hypothetical protein